MTWSLRGWRYSYGEGCGKRSVARLGEQACWYPSIQFLLQRVHLVPFWKVRRV